MQKKPGQGESHLVVTLAGQTHPGQLGRDPAADEGRRPGMGPRLAERFHGQPGPPRARRKPASSSPPRMRRRSSAAAPKRACCGSCSKRRDMSGAQVPRASPVTLWTDRRPPRGPAQRPDPAGAAGPLRAGRGGGHPREGGLLRRARPLDRHLPRARAHVLQGHAAPRRRRDRPGDQERGRLSQRQHRPTTTPRYFTVLPASGLDDRARHPVRRAAQLRHRRRASWRASSRSSSRRPSASSTRRAPSPTRRCTR